MSLPKNEFVTLMFSKLLTNTTRYQKKKCPKTTKNGTFYTLISLIINANVWLLFFGKWDISIV